MNRELFILGLFIISISWNQIARYVKIRMRKLPFFILKKINKDRQIYSFLYDIAMSLNASRCAVIEYSDGFATMQNEYVNEVTQPIINYFQHIRACSLSDMLLTLQNQGRVVVNQNSNTDIRLIHEAIGIKTSYKFKLYNSISKGCLVVAFDKDITLTPQQLSYIDEQLVRLKLIYH